MAGRFVSILLLTMLVPLLALNSSPVSAPLPEGTESLPPGAVVETLLSNMNAPTAMAFDPSGRLFYTEKGGNVRLFANGALQPSPVISYPVDTCSERGLLGIALDPNFAGNHFMYVYYTNRSGCRDTENRVARFVERDGAGLESVDIFSSPQTAGNHDGGNIHFGPDGKLYISIGDSANMENSQNLRVPNGKIHRINSDGSAPADNPRFPVTGAMSSIYAYGLRNSFDFTFDTVVRGRIFASENGPSCDDEMNRIERGFNYGWRGGYPCDDANPDTDFNTIPPLWYLDSRTCCEAPTGILVYGGDRVPQWKNGLFMAAYQQGKLRHFTLNADRTAVTSVNLVSGIQANMDIETGPDGAFYYMEGGGYQPGTLKRIVVQGTGPVPTPTPASIGQVPGPGSATFPETGKTVTGIFLDYWRNNGGLPQQGYPISGVLSEVSDLNGKPYVMQYFERAVFEYHPENAAPYNVLLSQLGTFQYRKKYPSGAPGQRPNSDPGSLLFAQTGKRLGGRFLEYWRANGGIAQQGYPISDEFAEVSDLNGKPYTVQYFERAVFEWHPENKAPFDVLLSQLGTFRFQEKYPGR